MPDFLVFSALIPKILGAKVILDIHDLMPELYAVKFNNQYFIQILLFIQKMSCKFADKILTVTSLWKKSLLKTGISSKKCNVLMNTPDEMIFKPINNVGKSNTHFNIVYHGTIVYRYGVDIAIKALKVLKKQIPEVKLNIIGEGDELEELTELTESLSLEDDIYFSKSFMPVEALPGIIAKMNVSVVPNRADHFTDKVSNSKLLEYVAMNTPVIASRTSGIKYYFNDSMVMFLNLEMKKTLQKKFFIFITI